MSFCKLIWIVKTATFLRDWDADALKGDDYGLNDTTRSGKTYKRQCIVLRASHTST